MKFDATTIGLLAGGGVAFLLCSTLYQLIVVVGVIVYVCTRPAQPKPAQPRSTPYGVARRGEGVPRRNILVGRGELWTTVDGCSTIPQLVDRAVKKYATLPLIGTRTQVKVVEEERTVEKNGEKVKKMFQIPVMTEYKFATYADFGDKVARFGSGLRATGLQPTQKVSIFANTRPEWQIAAQGCFAHNNPIVTVYASLGASALAYGFNQTEVTHVVTEASLVRAVLEAAKQCPALTTVIHTDRLSPQQMAALQKEFPTEVARIQFFSFDQVLELGASKEAPVQPPQPRDLAVIMYTSGSTGNPKGVMVSHLNVMAAIAGIRSAVSNLSSDDVYIAYLPLAHILEMIGEMLAMTHGASVGYANAKTLAGDGAKSEAGEPRGDIIALRPSLMAAVPAILDKLRDGIQAKVNKSSLVVRTMFKVAYYFKSKNWTAGEPSPGWDAIVFSKVSAQFGGRLKYLVSGGAPLSPATQQFMNTVLGVPVLQGYGLTETCAGGTICHEFDKTFGRVGAPIPSNEIKLVDVPEMGYTSDDVQNGVLYPRGEIVIRGGNVTMGYYKNEESTVENYKESKDDEGLGPWFYTGDIGMWHPDGSLQIIDRKKDLVKLAQGEYVALGKLESVYRQSPYVGNVCVYADSFHYAPVAAVVPNEPAVVAFARAQGIPNAGDLASLCDNPIVIKEVLDSLKALATKEKLHGFEIVAGVVLAKEEWTAANGMLTEALKLKRHPVNAQFKPQFEALYKTLGASS